MFTSKQLQSDRGLKINETSGPYTQVNIKSFEHNFENLISEYKKQEAYTKELEGRMARLLRNSEYTGYSSQRPMNNGK